MPTARLERVLFVDDEPHVLNAIRRQLHTLYDVVTAVCPKEGLELVARMGPFPVIVSDMKMPVMNGAAFLEKTREIDPDTVRMILSGQSGLDDAVEAVNRGAIFRFLTKPCAPETLTAELSLALEHHRLIQSERELLEQTLLGSVEMLSERDRPRRPGLGHAGQVTALVESLVHALDIRESWQVRVAARLCRLATRTIPDDLLAAYARELHPSSEVRRAVESHAAAAAERIAGIPRLETVATIVAQQYSRLPEEACDDDPLGWDVARLGSQMLAVCNELDRLANRLGSRPRAFDELESLPGFSRRLVTTLRRRIDRAPDTVPSP